MNCYRVRRLLAACCDDNPLPRKQREQVRLHLDECQSCSLAYQQYVRDKAALRSLPVRKPPAHLLANLRVVAAQERARRLARQYDFPVVAVWLARVRLWFHSMMRPLALPATGGLVSAVVLFALVLPNFFPLNHGNGSWDVPTVLSSSPTFLGMGPFFFNGEEAVVDVTLDSQGRFVDYSIPGRQEWAKDPEARRSIENALLFTRFSPGTTFGQPSLSRIRITLRRSYIDVRG